MMFRTLARALMLLAPAVLSAEPLAEPHIPILPRSAAEAAHTAEQTALPTDFSSAQPFEAQAAGAATVRVTRDANAFSLPSGNISFVSELDFKAGNGLFRQIWEAAPGAQTRFDGLGPLFNARSCQSCHLKAGRGQPPPDGEKGVSSLLLRVSIPVDPQQEGRDGRDADIAAYIATRPDPTYGQQLQDQAIPDHAPEARFDIEYTEHEVPLSGGQVAVLRSPRYRVADLGYGPMHPDATLSPRIAPQMIGLGLLEAIPAADILAWADPEDRNDDGISGRANVVWSHVHAQHLLGRFGLKAGVPTLADQTAVAFRGDIGLSSPVFPAGWANCTPGQAACRAAPHGTGATDLYETSQEQLDLVTFYTQNLAVPARRNVDAPNVLHGKQVFYETGCVACHRPSFVTHRLDGQPEQSAQLIWPYTDLLLHDMGPGLADALPEGRANGSEWRTPPLWGIGLTQQVSGHSFFLHDGRARSILEAVLWHGGEAQKQRDAVVTMPPVDRAALLAFLESL